MIRVCKQDPPARLKAGAARTEQNCADFSANSVDYLDGTRKFEFDRTIYGHETVKNALIKAQHKKCCFCEGRFIAHDYGDVEHYRPKGSVRQTRKAKALYPGYFWLAYSWDNLFFCCPLCNRTNKRDFFPLTDSAKRARSHVDNLDDEEPLILDPGGPEDPRRHIKFREDLARGVTEAGRKTIEFAGLNREALAEERLSRLNELRRLFNVTQVLDGNSMEASELLKDAQRELDAAAKPTERFSAMAADFLLAASNAKAPQGATD